MARIAVGTCVSLSFLVACNPSRRNAALCHNQVARSRVSLLLCPISSSDDSDSEDEEEYVRFEDDLCIILWGLCCVLRS